MAAKASNGSKDTVAKAYEEIKHRILTMDIKPGEVISENKLSQEVGVSRTPLREALKQLEVDGLIVSSGRRKRVFMLTIHEIEEIFELKVAIESSVARLATEKGQEQDFAELRDIVQHMNQFAEIVPEDTSEAHDRWLNEWLELDRRFHDLLFQMANNRRAEQVIKNLNYQWHRLRVGLLAMEGRIQKSVKEHTGIAQAILDGKSVEAEALMKDHLSNLKKMIITIMSAFHFPT